MNADNLPQFSFQAFLHHQNNMGNQPSSEEVIRRRLDRLRDDLANMLRMTVPEAVALQRILDELRDEIVNPQPQAQAQVATPLTLLLEITAVPRRFPSVVATAIVAFNAEEDEAK